MQNFFLDLRLCSDYPRRKDLSKTKPLTISNGICRLSTQRIIHTAMKKDIDQFWVIDVRDVIEVKPLSDKRGRQT